jgi:hypothetical protein
MRYLLVFGILIFGFSLAGKAQDADNVDEKDPYEWSAKVGSHAGIGWYVMAEPLRDYEVLDRLEIDVTNGQIDKVHLKQLYNVFKYRGVLVKSNYPDADGLLTMDGETVKVISYTDQTERHTRIGNVQTVAGKQVYLWSEALKVNNDAFRVPYQGQLKAQRNYLEKGMEGLVEKAKRLSQEKDQPFDALVIHKEQIKAIQYYTPGSS